ncbi:CRISPR-associated protein Cas4 [Thermodesulfatator indicus]
MKFVRPYIFQAYLTCPREAWLEYHGLISDQEHEFLALGRLVHESSYQRARKEIMVDNLLKIDLFRDELVAEVKKSSRHKEAAKLQLAFYLYYLKHEKGLILSGLLLFPKERKTEKVELKPELEAEIEKLLQEMLPVLTAEKPPPPVKSKFCRTCSFQEMCWG